MTENPALTEDQAQQIAAAVVFAQVKQQVDQGMPHITAIRGAVVNLLHETYGKQVWEELGVAERTARRWRSEYLERASAPTSEPSPAYLESVARLNQKPANSQSKLST